MAKASSAQRLRDRLIRLWQRSRTILLGRTHLLFAAQVFYGRLLGLHSLKHYQNMLAAG